VEAILGYVETDVGGGLSIRVGCLHLVYELEAPSVVRVQPGRRPGPVASRRGRRPLGAKRSHGRRAVRAAGPHGFLVSTMPTIHAAGAITLKLASSDELWSPFSEASFSFAFRRCTPPRIHGVGHTRTQSGN